MKYPVFYSWQAQLPNATNRSFVQSALEVAARAVRDDVTIEARPEIDRDTANVPGSPNIADTIRAKIDAAEIIVCDVSIVQGLDGDGERVRPTPNANVLVEVGYAHKSVGALDRLVLVMNTAFGSPDVLPFDLKQWRVTTYELRDGANNKADVRRSLAAKLEATFRLVLATGSRHAPRRNVVDEGQVAVLVQQLTRLADAGNEINRGSYHGPVDPFRVRYDGSLLDGAIRQLSSALAVDANVMSALQNAQDAVDVANGHAGPWRTVKSVDLGTLRNDAIQVNHTATHARNAVERLFGSAR